MQSLYKTLGCYGLCGCPQSQLLMPSHYSHVLYTGSRRCKIRDGKSFTVQMVGSAVPSAPSNTVNRRNCRTYSTKHLDSQRLLPHRSYSWSKWGGNILIPTFWGRTPLYLDHSHVCCQFIILDLKLTAGQLQLSKLRCSVASDRHL